MRAVLSAFKAIDDSLRAARAKAKMVPHPSEQSASPRPRTAWCRRALRRPRSNPRRAPRRRFLLQTGRERGRLTVGAEFEDGAAAVDAVARAAVARRPEEVAVSNHEFAERCSTVAAALESVNDALGSRGADSEDGTAAGVAVSVGRAADLRRAVQLPTEREKLG